MDVEVLGVVDVLVRARLDSIDDLYPIQQLGCCSIERSYSGFEVHQNGTRNVARVVGLVEEDIFAVAAFCSKVFEVAIAIDAVFLAELLPEL